MLVWSNIKICAEEESNSAFKMAATIFSFVTYFCLFLVITVCHTSENTYAYVVFLFVCFLLNLPLTTLLCVVRGK